MTATSPIGSPATNTRAAEMPWAEHAAPGAETVKLQDFGCLIAQLLVISGLAYHFALENNAFFTLTVITAAGFAIHYFLPLRWRLPFFVCLSLVAIGVLLGVGTGAWLIGISLAIIATCHLPVPFRLRVGILLVAGVSFAVLRGGWATAPWPAAIWPILGSIFMFRLAVYLYDVRRQPALASFWPTLAYFFLLPNVCFPLFPVVDYSTFRRTYYNGERHEIYGVGVEWIFRGTIQLILYRAVYQTLVLSPASVVNVLDLCQYLLWPFLLYLRVSGQFHIIVGILHLFGFNLPETHRSYFLSSSFTDFWRRINIYWKDFMMKVFFYPAYFALRRRGDTLALSVATLLVFVVTWLLHSYQWFWIQGSTLLTWNDAIFWGVLALLVLGNSLHEFRRGRRRITASASVGSGEALRLAARTVGMYLFISLLWSLWSTDSVSTWLSLWSAAGQMPSKSQDWLRAGVLAVPVAVGAWVIVTSQPWFRQRTPLTLRSTSALVVCTATLLVGISTSRVYQHFGPASTLMAAVRYGGLNQADAVDLERGYYENLMGVDRFNGELWGLYMNRPIDWARGLIDLGLAKAGSDPWELLPSVEGRFKGAVLRTNRWGMHDKEYDKQPPIGCFRIALLGASHVMGSGVVREDTFEATLERRLNQEGRCFEILNFAVYGNNPIDQIHVLEARVLEFRPQAIFYVGHPEDSQRVARFVIESVLKRKPLPDDHLSQVVAQAGVNADTPERVIVQHLAPEGNEILSWVYRRLIDDARERGICSTFIFLPMIPETPYPVDTSPDIELAKNAGFAVLDLSDVYAGSDRNALWVAEWDAHPNARGHRLIADRLYTLIRQNESAVLNCRSPLSPTAWAAH